MQLWRNWQPRQLEVLVVFVPWGFDSPQLHQSRLVLAPGPSEGRDNQRALRSKPAGVPEGLG